MTWQGFLQPGTNCWRLARADRLSFLIDAEAYFRAFKQAALRARRSILIVGWDINSQVELEFAEMATPQWPNRLGPFLTALIERKDELRVYVLNWDSPLLYKLDREWMPRLRVDWLNHERAHYVLDNQHPVGAAHHQKLVVIDDELAFLGGIDFSADRLDSREHIPADPRRQLQDGRIPDPVHDIQLAVSGPAARAIGDIARQRWEVATGQWLPPVEERHCPWPEDLAPALTDIDVAIARTLPAWKSLKAVREVEELFCSSIRAAQGWIYIESQYVTAWSVAHVLRERLEESGGPEVVLILPREPSGWIEQTAMGISQRRILSMLREVDHEGRFHAYVPMVGEAGDVPVKVHSKMMIIDGQFAHIGSANLNNRSMGLDTECDVALAGTLGSPAERTLLALRDDLLGEHLARPPEVISRAIAEKGSIVAAIEAERGEGRRLAPFPHTPPDQIDALISESGILDPTETSAPERMADEFVENRINRMQLRNAILGVVAVLAVLAALAAFWRMGPGAEFLDAARLEELARLAPNWWSGAAVTVGAFFIGGLLMFPVTILVIATGLIHGPWTGLLLALAGALGSALLGYGVGALLGKEVLRRLMRGRLEHVSQILARRGMLSVTLIRLLPIAPFTLVNMAAGASHIRLRDYTIGTLFGMAPGIVAVTLFSGQLRAVLISPSWHNILFLVLIFGIIVLVGLWLWRRFAARLEIRNG